MFSLTDPRLIALIVSLKPSYFLLWAQAQMRKNSAILALFIRSN